MKERKKKELTIDGSSSSSGSSSSTFTDDFLNEIIYEEDEKYGKIVFGLIQR